MSVLNGIGFTTSFFVATLAFEDSAFAAGVRLGVLAGSIASALLGRLVLRTALAPDPLPHGAHGRHAERG